MLGENERIPYKEEDESNTGIKEGKERHGCSRQQATTKGEFGCGPVKVEGTGTIRL